MIKQGWTSKFCSVMNDVKYVLREMAAAVYYMVVIFLLVLVAAIAASWMVQYLP